MRQHPTRRQALITTAATLGLGMGLAPAAWAQAGWPHKPVKLVVNFPPGGAADTLARLISRALGDALGQPLVIENRGGSGGNLGADVVAKSAADGYTLLMSSGSTISIGPHIYAKMPFDPAKDLVPVSGVARVSVYLVCKPDLPAANLQEFMALLRARPGQLTYGSPGNGSSPHLAAEMMKSQTNTFAVHVPYRGAGPALNDLLGGQIDFAFDPGVGLQHVKTGRLRLLAVGSPQRSPLFPQTPTPAEFNRRMQHDSQRFGKIIRERKIVGD